MSKPAATEHGRGEIRDNAIKALVTSKLFQTRVVKAKKGKGEGVQYSVSAWSQVDMSV